MREKRQLGHPDVRPIEKWTDADVLVIGETIAWPVADVCRRMQRSVSSVTNARVRYKRANGLPVRAISKDHVPEQDLWERPPGTYVEVVGRLLMEYPDVMDAWMHAHGYAHCRVVFEDSSSWVTLACVKED
jgi:hypothetical protein